MIDLLKRNEERNIENIQQVLSQFQDLKNEIISLKKNIIHI